MDNKQNFWPFAIGAVLGAAVVYFLKSDKKDELVNDVKEVARKAKAELEELLKKVQAEKPNTGQ